jgi:hypothetical protein
MQVHSLERRLTNAGLQITCPFLETYNTDVIFVALECHDSTSLEEYEADANQLCLWIPLRHLGNDIWVRDTLPSPITLWRFDEH